MRVVAALSLLVLALAATGGEARESDGVSGRQLLTDPKPVVCKDPNCDKVLKKDYKCEWLPEADIKCDNKDKYKVSVKNCFKKKVDYISISVDGKCNKYPGHGDVIAMLELKCGENITIFGYDKYFKGNTDKGCSDSSSRMAGNYCKTCKYEAEFKCPKDLPKPGMMCRRKYDCELSAVYDNYCNCPHNFLPATHMCRNSTGVCDAGAKCTGDSKYCPRSGYKDKYTVCRAKDGDCDVAEYCTGNSGDCPDNKWLPYGKKCRPARKDKECEKDAHCTGNSGVCPPNKLHKEGKLCRKKRGECDLPDFCDGTTADCYDKKKTDKQMCRDKAGPCDAPEFCDGITKSCPKDVCIDYKTELTKDHPYWHGGRD